MKGLKGENAATKKWLDSLLKDFESLIYITITKCAIYKKSYKILQTVFDKSRNYVHWFKERVFIFKWGITSLYTFVVNHYWQSLL